ncbi:MAG: glutathione S-transferase [Pseudomonadota bacterium]
MSDTYTLYGMSASLYTGKVRAYLIHHGIPFEERGAGHPTFMADILPQLGRWIIPVVVTPDGTVLQDGTAIIDYFEAKELGRYSVIPSDPVARSVAYIFELFGGEGLLRPAMHYRWGFDADNLDFLRVNFAEAFPAGLSPDQKAAMFEQSSGRMRKAGAAFGVSQETAPTIEETYKTFLGLLDAHFTATPYLLSDRASLGDYGLMNGLFAHLARDPHPALIMKRLAPAVFTWTERMNRPFGVVTNETAGSSEPHWDTLNPLMKFIADDFLSEIMAHTEFTRAWLDDDAPSMDKPIERSIGMCTVQWQGHQIQTAVMPYRHWLLQRLQDEFETQPQKDQTRIHAHLTETGLNDLLGAKLPRRVERRGNREFWGSAS